MSITSFLSSFLPTAYCDAPEKEETKEEETEETEDKEEEEAEEEEEEEPEDVRSRVSGVVNVFLVG